MRRYRVPLMTCQWCGEVIKSSEYGGWTHVMPMRITDPKWHSALPKEGQYR
jgi:hypothetical protein